MAKPTQFTSIKSLHKIADIVEDQYPKVAKAIREAYSDNVLVSGFTPEECNKTLKDCIMILERYKFGCHDIFSETPEILVGIEKEKLSLKTNYSIFNQIYQEEEKTNTA